MVRFSPSPMGDMSLSELRVALLSYICAKQVGEQLIVRIEGKEQDTLDMLALFGISYSQLYYQNNNFKYHLQFASTLLDTKKAFICFCPHEASSCESTCEHLSPEEVINNPHPFVIRMKKSDTASDSFIIMRTDKYPTPTFARACDDMLQGVTTLIQEEKYLNDAPKEEWVRKSLGYDQAIHYVYIPTFQRHENEQSIKELLDEGLMPEAIVNYLLAPTKMLTLEEAMSTFDLQTLGVPLAFEREKLRFINREHIKKLSDMELSKRLGYACENIGKLAKVYSDTACTTLELKVKIDTIFAKKEPLEAYESESKTLQELILKAPYFEVFDDFKAYLETQSGLQGEAFLRPLCFWLTGADDAPLLATVYPLLKTYLKEIVR